MKELKKLIDSTKNNGLSQAILFANKKKNSKTSLLYDLINKNEIKCENKIVQIIYNQNCTASYNTYVKLKSRLKQIINQSISLIKPSGKYEKLSKDVNQQLSDAKNYFMIGLYDKAIHCIHKTRFESEKVDLFEVASDASSLLMKIGTETNDSHLFKSAKQDFERYDVLRVFYNKVNNEYQKIRLQLKDRPYSQDDLKIVKDAIKNLDEFDQSFSYFSLTNLYYSLYNILYTCKNNYKAVLDNSHKAIESLKDAKFDDLVPLNFFLQFNSSALDAYKKLGLYDSGMSFLNSLNDSETKDTFFLIKKYEILFYFGQNRFHDAYEIITQSKKNEHYKILTDYEKEVFELYYGFAIWALKVKIKTNNSMNNYYYSNKIRSFKLKDLNEFKEIRNKKEGELNSFNILQILFGLLNSDEDKMVDQEDKLKKHSSSYLKSDKHKRLNFFIDYLLSLPQNHYDYLNTLQRKESRKKFNLKESPINKMFMDYEIIQFDQITDMLISLNQRSTRLVAKHFNTERKNKIVHSSISS